VKRVYIAGPMRGIPLYNFPAFDKAAAKFRAEGWEVINPAEMDRSRGFNEAMHVPDRSFLKSAIMADLQAISECTAVAFLPGWQKSKGALAEKALAEFLGLVLVDAHTMDVLGNK
jgi:hypothetical protein